MASVYWRHDRYYLQYKNVPGRAPAYVRIAGEKGWSKQQALQEAHARERAATRGMALVAGAEDALLSDLCDWWWSTWCPAASRGREVSRLKVHVKSQPIGRLPQCES